MRPTAVAAVFAVVVAACGGGGAATEQTAGTEAPTSTTTTQVSTTQGEAVPAATVGTADTDLGTVLVDGDGMTLYVFLPDDRDEPTCYDECAGRWPPLIGEVTAGDGVDTGLIGSVTRKAGPYQKGEVQVTYGGWPLYRFAGDQAPGDTNGQGVKGVWYVIDPSGAPIR